LLEREIERSYIQEILELEKQDSLHYLKKQIKIRTFAIVNKYFT